MTTKTRKTGKTIPVRLDFKEWHKDPEYRREYEALEEEFSIVEQLVGARAAAGLTQQQLAERMQTSQAFIARLESGRENPSTRTLKRFAKATGHRFVFSLEPLEVR